MVDSKTIQLYEQRIARCFGMAEKFTPDTWGHEFWTRTAMVLLHKLNLMLCDSEDKVHG